jgi:hypothetical protein
MHAELQKFGRDREGTRQLALLTGIEEPEVAGAVAEVTGLALSVAEDRALSAIQILLDRTGYRGNVPGPGEERSEAFSWKGTLPRLAFSWEDYHQAYGLQPDRQGQYRGKAALEARAALESLAEPRRITYRRPRFVGHGKGRKKVFDVIVAHKPLVEITKGYKGLTGPEADAVAAGAGRPSRVTRLLVEVSPLLLDQLDTFHLLKPEGLHQEIERLLGGKRYSEVIPRFLNYLLTKNSPVVRVDEKTLLQRLRLDHLVAPKHRQGSRVRQRLEECCKVALGLGYLTRPAEKRASVYLFHLDPGRCSRVAWGEPAAVMGDDSGGGAP